VGRRIDQLVTFNYLIGSETHDIPALSIVPQPQHYCVPIIIIKLLGVIIDLDIFVQSFNFKLSLKGMILQISYTSPDP
jgi:uncharacterized membrane protein YciS (DUF1049 family)